MPRRPIPVALLSAGLFISIFSAAASVPAETSVTIYSSAQPGSLSPDTFRSGDEAYPVPG